MAITKIDAIYLNTAVTYVQVPTKVTTPDGVEHDTLKWVEDETSDSYKAKAHLDSLGIKYNWLNYADPEQHVEVFPPLNNWVFEDGLHTFNEFPFLFYTKCDDALPLEQWPKAVIMGLQNIQSSNIAELYAVGRPSGSTSGA
jgi:hypothetical protein